MGSHPKGIDTSVPVNKMNAILVDFQGFKDNQNAFIIKELAFCDLVSENKWKHFTFRPPYPKSELFYKVIRANEWCTRNLHGFKWEDGRVPYAELTNVLQTTTSNFKHVITKGQEKAKFLSSLLQRTVTDLEKVLQGKLADLPDVYVPCTHGTRCALKGVRKMQNWVISTCNILGVELKEELICSADNSGVDVYW